MQNIFLTLVSVFAVLSSFVLSNSTVPVAKTNQQTICQTVKTNESITVKTTKFSSAPTTGTKQSLTTAKSAPAATVKPTNKQTTTTASQKATVRITTQKPITTTKQTTTSGINEYANFQNEVVAIVNAERAKNGLSPLTVNSALSHTATLKSQDMAALNYFDHTSPTYGSPFDMMRQFGITYRTAGENIATGQSSPQEVMTGWMNSPGHRKNILNASFTQIGVGIAKNAQGRYIWTQQFIG